LTDPPRLELPNGFVLDAWTIEDAASRRVAERCGLREL
jgi:ADP-ribose pyrophosphatase YjhB (NUDIX family)